MTIGMWFASAMWVLLAGGYFARHNRRIHVPLVLTAICGDIALVGYLSVTRDAVQTAMQFKLEALQQVHIAASTVALILYFPAAFLGCSLFRGNEKVRTLHKQIASAALILRTIGFIFMFSMWKS
ncbi:MAG: hypothetical protein J5J00_16725 [Deltaproteobacteria bacterium]|nr:hypothetical protein [Deltaproteobacteria bacterium]